MEKRSTSKIDQQLWITHSLACLASAEWHCYSIDALQQFYDEVVRSVYSLCNQNERRFLEGYGQLLKAGAIPAFPMMAKEFDKSDRSWLRRIYEIEFSPANAVYYARLAAGACGRADVNYLIDREDGENEEQDDFEH